MKKVVTWIVEVAFLLLLIWTVLTFAIAIGYTFPRAVDDFSLANRLRDLEETHNNIFSVAFSYMLTLYPQWQGTFASWFFMALLSPLNGAGIIQLRIVLLCLFFCFLGLLWICSCKVYRHYFGNMANRFLFPLYVIMVTAILSFKLFWEVLYWYSGAMHYLLPIVFFLAMVLALFWAIDGNKPGWYVLGGVLAFLISGFSLQTVALNCLTLLYLSLSVYKNRKVISVFVAACVGAIINVISPGNYIRHDVIDATGMHYGRAIFISGSKVFDEIKWLITETPFFLCFLVAICIGAISSLQTKKMKWTTILYLITVPFAVVYPVELGYSGLDFPNRCQFALDACLIIEFLFVGVYLGNVFNGKQAAETRRKYIIIGILGLGLLWTILFRFDYGRLKSTETFVEIVDGRIPRYSRDHIGIYKHIEESAEEDVLITLPVQIANYIPFEITENPDHGINTNLSMWYNKKSVRIANR